MRDADEQLDRDTFVSRGGLILVVLVGVLALVLFLVTAG